MQPEVPIDVDELMIGLVRAIDAAEEELSNLGNIVRTLAARLGGESEHSVHLEETC